MASEDHVVPGVSAAEAGGDYAAMLRASQELFEREFGRAPYGLIAASLGPDLPGAYLAVNGAFCDLAGYSRDELLGRDFVSDFHPEEQPAIDVLVQKAASGTAGGLRLATRLVRKGGDVVPVRMTGHTVHAPSGERYLTAYVENDTAVEEARAEIGQLQLDLHRSRRLESIGHLVAGTAHEFNNLLTVISSYASLVRDEVSIAEATEGSTRWGSVRWDVDQISAASDRATRLTRRLLATASKEQAKPRVLDVTDLIADVSRLLGDVLGEHISVVTRHSGDLWPVEADPGLLEQVILNIMVNARAAMPGGGQVSIETSNIDTEGVSAPADMTDRRATFGASELPPGQYVEIRIADAGTGMSEAIAERAFEPFFTARTGDQAGLGLSVVRMFAAQAGGRAWLRSAPGAGTTVAVTLPAAAAASAASADRGDAEGAREDVQTVIVVDDEAAIRAVAHRVLSRAGYSVVTAANGQEVLSLLRDRETHADMILADVVMPGLTGRAFAEQVGKLRPAVPVLFMSGYERPADLADSWPGTETHVLAKPFSRAALLTAVSELLAAGSPAGHPA
jgi:PAS domain S-box-containing protein